MDNKLVIAVTSRALFNLDDSHAVFEQQGVDAFCQYQIANEDRVLEPGIAFNLVRKLLQLNSLGPEHLQVEIILLSRNSADTGLRVFNSIDAHGLDITRAVFTGGESPSHYAAAFGAHLFLSADPEDVKKVLGEGLAAATIVPSKPTDHPNEQLRIAFDGDAVLFSDESERVYKQHGLDAFSENERANARNVLPGGPFKRFLEVLHQIQSAYPPNESPIRTALVTARAAPAHERVIRTLRAWNIRIDEALFLGGLPKGPFLKAYKADIFFDDQVKHCQSASEHVATGHVPHGVANDVSEPMP